MDGLNIQLCPTPLFYIAKDVIVFFPERAGVGIAVVGGYSMNSTQIPLGNSAGLNVNFPHGQPIAPAFIRTVLLCTAPDADSGSLVGDEIEIVSILDQNNTCVPFTVGADAVKIYAFSTGPTGTTTQISGWRNGTLATFGNFNNFSLKVYWQ